MIYAIVLVPLFCVICVAGYFLVGKYDKFVRRNKQYRRGRKNNNRRTK